MKFTWYHFLFAAQLVAASPRHSSPFPPVTSTSPYEETSSLRELKKRQTTLSSPAAAATTCGYLSGDANLPVTGGPGSSCAIDTTHDLWGICPSTALIGSPDCNLPAFCVDVLSCVGTCPWNSIGSTTTQADSTGGILTWYVMNYPWSSYSKSQAYNYIARKVEQTFVGVSNISSESFQLKVIHEWRYCEETIISFQIRLAER